MLWQIVISKIIKDYKR